MSPCFNLRIRPTKNIADVPLLQANEYLEPVAFEIYLSNSETFGPVVKKFDFKHLTAASISFLSIDCFP